MKNRIFINGAAGKMGKMAIDTVDNDPALELVGEGFRGDDLLESIRSSQADIVVDFTNATSVYENTKSIIKAGAHPVIGTSGLAPHQVEELQTLCESKQLGGLIVPNFSISVVLMMQFAKQAATLLPHVEIIELHHDGKQDAPSGTAIKTAEMIAEQATIEHPKPCQEIISGARGAKQNQIPIHSIRLPGLLAHQQIIFGNTGETLTLKHDSINRECFMPGLLLACKQVSSLKKLLYGLENIL